MAQYFRTFDADTIGNAPSGMTGQWWASTWEVNALDGPLTDTSLYHNNSSTLSRQYGLSLDEVGSVTDVEVLVPFLVPSGTASSHRCRVIVRGAGSSGSETGYFLEWSGSSGGRWEVGRFSGGSYGPLDNSSFSLSADTWYWLRLRVNGSTIQGRFWEDGDAEPGSWLFEETDSTITGAGWVGVSGRNLVYFGQIGVGTNGDTAPSSPPAVNMPARGGLIVGGRAALTVTKKLEPRGGLIVGGRADLTAKTPLPARGGLVLGGRATLSIGEPEVNIPIRGGLVVGGRVALTPTRQIPARGGLVLGGRATLSVDDGNIRVEPRGGFVVGGRAALTVTVPMDARAGLVVGGRAHLTVTHTLKVRGGIVLGGRDAYTGPGSGIVVQGARFNPNDIREGDSFNVYLPWAGIEGMGTLAHAKSRTISDQMAEQDLSLQVVPQPDPKLVPGMAGGGRPGLKPLRSDVARKAARAQREIDRLDRNRS